MCRLCRSPFIMVVLLFVVTPSTHSAPKQGEWIEVRGPHFAVVSDAGEERTRRVAGLLETIREVFLQALPGVPPRGGPPLDVFAAKNRESLRELLPQYADTDPRRMPLGVYFRTPDKSFIVLLEDADTENPYETVYHEYFHSLATPAAPGAPLWFHEGIAGFWENERPDEHRGLRGGVR